jgi:hypothetical protein
VITPGTVVRVEGWPGLWRACEPAKSGHDAWWLLPCGEDGKWNRREGWRAAYESRLSVPEKMRTKRHYTRKLALT